jgi:7-cyano-7-deazaguanine synthase
MSRRRRKAVVLLSGGLDSSTTLYEAKRQGYRCMALVFDYGQRHRREVQSALAVARSARCPIRVIRIRLPWGGSALTDRTMPIPSDRSLMEIGRGIPPTYVPARNTILLGYAVSCAEAIGADAVFIGANALDMSGYPDCRPAYYQAFQKLIRLGTKAGAEGRPIRIVTPLLKKTKAQIVRHAVRLGVPLEKTWSCYRGGVRPCGRCDSCLLRAKGFAQAGLKDPASLRP